MNGESVRKYALWFAILTMSLICPLVILLVSGRDVASDPNGYDIGNFSMAISSMILIFTAMLGPVMVEPHMKSFPKWALVIGAYGFVGLFAMLFLATNPDRTSLVSFVYIPITVFFLNLVLTFTIQTWVASEKLEISLWKTLPVHGLFAVWTCFALTHPANTIFFTTSSLGLLVVLSLAVRALLVVGDTRLQQAAAERSKPTE